MTAGMLSIFICMSTGIGLHVLLTLVLEITEFPLRGNSVPDNETCVNVTGEIVCYFNGSVTPVDWYIARQLCTSLHSTLPVIRNKNDQDALAGYLKSRTYNFSAWTAGKIFKHTGWTWVNGEQLKETVQEEIEPQLPEAAYATLAIDFKFVAAAASEELPYICQYDGAFCDYTSDIIVSDECIRLMNDIRTSYDARNQCIMSGGDLAVVREDVHRRLKTLTLNQSYWIGLRKKSFRWTLDDDVESNDEMKFTNWEINIFSLEGECVSIDTSSGQWKAIGYNELRAVVCQKGQDMTSSMTTETSENIQTGVATSYVFAAVGAAIVGLLIFCIIVVIVLRLRTANRSVKEIVNSNFNNSSLQNNREELYTQITNAHVNTSASPFAYTSIKRSDDILNDYEEITMAALDQLQDGATNQQPEMGSASFKCQKESIKLEPDTKHVHTTAPNKIGPLGDIYARPDAKVHAVDSPDGASGGSNSHPILVTAQGDIYALPMKTSTSSTANQPDQVFYANLQTEMLDKQENAGHHQQTTSEIH